MAVNDRVRLFIAEYLLDLNATQAAIRAGYSPRTAKQQGSRLLTRADVQEGIAAAQAQRAQRVAAEVAKVEVKADDVLRELMAVAFSDLGQMFEFTQQGVRFRNEAEIPEAARRAISSIKVKRDLGGETRPVSETVEFKLWDKNTALDKLARHLGLLKDKVEHTGPNGGPIQHEHDDISGLTDEELVRRYQAKVRAS